MVEQFSSQLTWVVVRVRHNEDFERELLLRLEPLFERLVPETGLPSPGKLRKNLTKLI